MANDDAEPDVRMAAGLVLKNAFSSRDYGRLREVQARWMTQIGPEIKESVKNLALKTLASKDSRAGAQAAQFIASIAAIDLPRNQWPQLMQTLVVNVGEGHDQQKQASLATIGFICEIQDPDLQTSLSQHSNTILTAVVQGARKEETNNDVRNAAMTALGDSLEFVRLNFENEGERNYIMQVVCEATQANDTRIIQGAYGCLNRIMALYYDKMFFYMEKALFGLTIQGMKHEEEDVAKLAVEFWCTVCEEEISIEDDNVQASLEGQSERPYFNFARIATQEVIPVLLELLTKQDEDAPDEEYNTHRAAYQCLQLWAQAVGGNVVAPVLQFIEANIRQEDWHLRDAAASAFGAILEGPEEKMIDNIVKQGLNILISMMEDPVVHVKDSVAFTLGRISECASGSIDPNLLEPLVRSLFTGLTSNPKMASSCCWALMNLAERFAGDVGCEENPMTPHFEQSVSALLQTTDRNDADNGVRTAAYEVLNTFITNSAMKSVPMVAQLSEVILQRLEGTIPLRQQVVSVEDGLTLDNMQASLASVVMSIIQRLESEIAPLADRIMHILLQVLGSVNNRPSVPEAVFAAVGALANSLDEEFAKYMDSFNPFLFKALNNRDDAHLCSMSIGLVSDITRSLGPQAQPYCNELMNSLLENLRSTALSNQFKPAILQTFGDIAQAIGGAYETYLPVVAQVLDQAASINIDVSVSYEMLDYVVSLREGIMDAWAGTIIAMKAGSKCELLQPYVESIFRLLHVVFQDQNRSEALLRSSMGVVGDLAVAFPGGECAELFKNPWVTAMIKETKSNRDFSPSTIAVAKWAKEQITKQTGGASRNSNNNVNMA